MKARTFFYSSLIFSAVIVILMVLINIQLDLYGLFHSTKEKLISIYSDERAAKYLLAHRYVPENFEGYILGPSLSANLNPEQVKRLKIYNLSMMGANITEQKAVLDKALESATPKFVILCLHPYLTTDHGMKTDMINPKQYFGALGSMGLYKAYALKLVRHFNLMPAKFPSGQFNGYGNNNYIDLLQEMPVEDKINEQLQRSDAVKTAIDPVAWKELISLVDELVSRKVSIIAYYHPLPFPLFDKFRNPYGVYKHRVDSLLENKSILIDFNATRYEFFTKDFSNYIDHGHLSEKGQSYLLEEIISKAALLPPASLPHAK